jgi:pimeloyl-ACP methyl ester carboxylesterase
MDTSATSLSTPSFLILPEKPSSPISYTFFPATNSTSASTTPTKLILFINGLGLPAASWVPSIELLQANLKPCPSILTYDRFGQGLTTARDPIDEIKPSGHDFLDVATDLHSLLSVIATSELSLSSSALEDGKLQLLIIGASIGAPIARLYIQHHPNSTAGLILLDSNIANANYSDIWPDPDAPDFDPASVIADDCTLEKYRIARKELCGMFDLNVKNAEGLDRSTSPVLVPRGDWPRLEGVEGGPWLSVVGHDPVTFAEMSWQMMGTPRSCSDKFTNKYVPSFPFLLDL